MSKYRFTLLLLILQLATLSQDFIKNKIDLMLANDRKEDISVLVYDPISMDTLFAKNIFENLIPASNVKLFTTTTALNLLAEHKHLLTKIFTDDEYVGDSIINGNIYIKGFGDALFTESKLDSLVINIVELGIKKIEGDVISDETYFDKVYTRDDWITDEKANVTLPPISGLSLNRNSLVVTFNTSAGVGKKPTFNITPRGDFYSVVNSLTISNSKSYPKLRFRSGDNKISLQFDGTVRKRRNPYSYIVYPDSPAVWIANLFRQKLVESGIEVIGNVKSSHAPLSVFELATSRSSLSNFVNRVNKKSDNYLAENLFKILGAEYSNKQGNSFYATQAVMSFLDEHDIYNEGTTLVDGSGISRFNKTSTAAIVSLLEYVYLDLEKFDFIYNSLSISGRDGTLDNRMINSAAYSKFHGKTGTLNGVSSISGYLTTKDNRDLIISIIMNFKSKGQNHYRDLQDKIIEFLAESL